MERIGNISLLDRKKIGYFASGTIASQCVLPTLDWAAEVAKHDDVAIVSGFHSKMEREALDFLLRGRCGIICVLARSIYKKIPDRFREAYDTGRILFISPCKTSAVMTSRHLCQQRNEYVTSISDELVFSSLTTESSLYLFVHLKTHVLMLWLFISRVWLEPIVFSNIKNFNVSLESHLYDTPALRFLI